MVQPEIDVARDSPAVDGPVLDGPVLDGPDLDAPDLDAPAIDGRAFDGPVFGAGRVEAVLFDMDGTLVESHAAVERAWRTWAREHNADPDAVLAVAHGAPAHTTARRFLPDLDADALAVAAARQLDLQYDDLSDVTAIPGAHELLAHLDANSVPWAIVTSADVRLAEARLGAAGITPPLLVTVEDIAEGKPAPDGYLRAAALLGVSPTRCLVVEDAEVGVQAGRAAGAHTVGVRGATADITLTNLSDVTGLLFSPTPPPTQP